MVRNLGRPAAAEMAIEQVAFDRLTKTRGTAGNVDFPTWSEVQRAPHWIVDLALAAAGLQGLDVTSDCGDRFPQRAGLCGLTPSSNS